MESLRFGGKRPVVPFPVILKCPTIDFAGIVEAGVKRLTTPLNNATVQSLIRGQ